MSSSSSSSSSSQVPPLPSAHGITFSDNANRITAEYPDFTGYREGYTDPSVLALKGVETSKLPKGWEKLPLTSAPSRLYELPRQKFYTPLSETDERYADVYSNAWHAPEGKYIVPEPREKRMSKAERDEWRLKQASERRERIYNAPEFKGKDGKPDLSLIYQAKHAYTQRQAMKAQEERARKWREKWGTPEKYQAFQKSLALKNIGRRLPASITDASYLDYLNRDEIAGYSRDQLPTGFEYLRESNFVGKTPQTLTPAEKNKMMLQFGELVGILGVDPVYDPRLTSVASAQALYPAPDYTVSVYNLDDNILTPGTVIVQTNISTRDYAGNFVPEGQIIAIGGYKLANPSSARSIAELERMMYYGENDTNEKRQKQTFQDWKVEHGFIKPKQKATGMRQIADFVKSILEREGIEMPVRVKVGDRFTEMPAFMKLRFMNTLGKEMIATYYKVSSVVMNTIISRTAELFFNFVIAPLLYNDLKNETSNLMISSFLKACAESESIPWDADKFFNLTRSTADMSSYLGVEFNRYIMIFWKKSYFHPKALGAFLHYKTIKDKVDKLITQWNNQINADEASAGSSSSSANTSTLNSIFDIIINIVKTVMFFTMNSNVESYLDEMMLNTISTSKNLNDAIIHATNNLWFDFCSNAEVDAIVNKLGKENEKLPLTILSARAWDKDIRIAYKISERGKTALPETIANRYAGGVIPFSSMELYTQGRKINSAARKGTDELAARMAQYQGLLEMKEEEEE